MKGKETHIQINSHSYTHTHTLTPSLICRFKSSLGSYSFALVFGVRRGLVTTLKAATESFINSAIGWQQISYIFGVIYIAFPLIRTQLLRSLSLSLSHTPSLIELNFPFLSCTQLHMCDNCELPLPLPQSLPSAAAAAAAAVKCFTHTQCSHSCFSLSAHSASLSLACMLRRSLKPLSLPKCLALSCSLSARALSSTLALSLSVHVRLSLSLLMTC